MQKKTLLLAAALISLLLGAYAGTITRGFSFPTVEPGQSLTVSLTVNVDEATEDYYAIDEDYPGGWTVSNPGGGAQDEAGHLKWVVIENAADTVYTYVLTAPSTEGGYTFGGIFQTELMGNPINILGPTSVTVAQTGECTQNPDCGTGEICCNSSCVAPACTQNSDCGTGYICQNPGTCNATCVSGCSTSADCSGGQVCCAGQCREPTCVPGSDCCTSTGCDYASNGTVCGTIPCPDDYCGGEYDNTPYTFSEEGCERQCTAGTCGTSCAIPCSATSQTSCGNDGVCTGGRCLTCGASYSNCDFFPSNGCEVNILTNEENCGFCGNECGENEQCLLGSCAFMDPCAGVDCGENADCSSGFCRCDSGWFDCDDDTSNGCEVQNLADCPCENEDSRDCTTVDSCAGTQTCSNEEWGSCVKNAPTCVPNEPRPCTPEFDGNSCSAIAGTQNCDSCGTSWRSCVPDNGEVCCPDSTRSCDTPQGCQGIQSCSGQGQWSECEVNTTVCTAEEVGTCTPVINGILCSGVSGNRTCDACGSAWSVCEGPTNVSCCPGQTEECTIEGCIGTRTCDSAGGRGNCAKNDPSCGETTGPGPGGATGPGEATLTVHIIGECIGQPTTVQVLNESGNPAGNALVQVTKGSETVSQVATSATGKVTFTLNRPGEYFFRTTKSLYYANIQGLTLRNCGGPMVRFEEEVKLGENQTVLVIGSDGNTIKDFVVTVTYPDGTTRALAAVEGVVELPVVSEGSYSMRVETEGFSSTVGFLGIGEISIDPSARPTVSALFGEETVYAPNYLIIWILAIAIISGLIIEVTKLRPGWFRVFVAATYTLLPLIVNHYTGSIFLSFAVIAIQTVLLTALWFRIWKAKQAMRNIAAE